MEKLLSLFTMIMTLNRRQSTDKIFKIAWEYRNGKYDRVDKEIKFEEFHDWLIEKLSSEWTK